MNRDKLPMSRREATDLALRAYSALNEFRNGSALTEHWQSLAEVLNTVNALMCLGRNLPGVSPLMIKALYLGLQSTECTGNGSVDLDATLVPPLAVVIGVYDDCLHGLARRTLSEAMVFIDQ